MIRRTRQHGQPANQRGAVLVLVVVYIVLAFGLIALLGATGSLLARRTRAERGDAQLRQMLDSAHAWARVHAETLSAGDTVELDARTLVAGDPSGTIEVRLSDDILFVSATLETSGRPASRSASFPAP